MISSDPTWYLRRMSQGSYDLSFHQTVSQIKSRVQQRCVFITPLRFSRTVFLRPETPMQYRQYAARREASPPKIAARRTTTTRTSLTPIRVTGYRRDPSHKFLAGRK